MWEVVLPKFKSSSQLHRRVSCPVESAAPSSQLPSLGSNATDAELVPDSWSARGQTVRPCTLPSLRVTTSAPRTTSDSVRMRTVLVAACSNGTWTSTPAGIATSCGSPTFSATPRVTVTFTSAADGLANATEARFLARSSGHTESDGSGGAAR